MERPPWHQRLSVEVTFALGLHILSIGFRYKICRNPHASAGELYDLLGGILTRVGHLKSLREPPLVLSEHGDILVTDDNPQCVVTEVPEPLEKAESAPFSERLMRIAEVSGCGYYGRFCCSSPY